MTVHDLPPRWDGFDVEWRGTWEPAVGSLTFHLADFGACDQCGALGGQVSQWGSYRAKGLRLAHSPLEGSASRYRGLLALRCEHCRHTTVTETNTHQMWDLGPEDYTDEGSYDVARKQGTLF